MQSTVGGGGIWRGFRGSGSWRASNVAMARGGGVNVEGRRCICPRGVKKARTGDILRRVCEVVVVVFVLVSPPWVKSSQVDKYSPQSKEQNPQQAAVVVILFMLVVHGR